MGFIAIPDVGEWGNRFAALAAIGILAVNNSRRHKAGTEVPEVVAPDRALTVWSVCRSKHGVWP